jgi:hypothetical protein
LSLQTLGGSGFLQDYPMEQYIRDTKIDTLYEGTTGIQGQDFFFRKIVRDKSVALDILFDEMTEFLAEHENPLLRRALEDVQAMVETMKGWQDAASTDVTQIYKVGQNTTRLLMSVGDLVIGWLLARQAAIAAVALPTASAADVEFYQGKVAVASFFARTVLPELATRRQVLEQTDNSLMEVADGAF